MTSSEESIRYQEKRTIEQISYYFSRDHRIIFRYPATLLEAKHILNNKKMGNTKIPKDFKPLEESGQPTNQNNEFKRYKYENNFQQNFHSGNQVPQNFNPRYKGKNFKPFYNGNKPNFTKTIIIKIMGIKIITEVMTGKIGHKIKILQSKQSKMLLCLQNHKMGIHRNSSLNPHRLRGKI